MSTMYNPVINNPYPQDPMQPMMDPTYVADPRNAPPPQMSTPITSAPPQGYDPRMDPRNRRARAAAQNPLMTPPPPGMQYGVAPGAPTAGFGAPPPQSQNPLTGQYGKWASMRSGPTMGYGNPAFNAGAAQGAYGGFQNAYNAGNGGLGQSQQSLQRAMSPSLGSGMSGMMNPGRLNVGFRDPQGLQPGRASYQF